MQLQASRVGLCVDVAMVASAGVVPRQIRVFALGVVSVALLADSTLWPATEGRQLVVWQLVVHKLDPLVADILGPTSLPLVVPALPIPLLLVGYVILALSCIQLATPLSPFPALLQLSFASLIMAKYPSFVAFPVFET